ncbi:MAG: C-terminal binding protein [Natronomonas sp.]|nr:C-terminal binding protein [Natronomonas sp.]
MTSFTVVVTDHDFESLDIEEALLGDVATICDLSESSESEFGAALAEADGVLNLRRNLNSERIADMQGCRIIARYGIGVDNIDADAAAEQGIYVTNVPNYCDEEVSDHAMALLLAIARGVMAYDKSVAEGEWDRDVATPLHRLSTQTAGIVGFGAIGRALGRRLDALGFTVLASDPFLSEEDVSDEPASLVSFETVLAESDYVSIHSPLTEDTRGMFDADAFKAMKDDAALINVARGPIVNEGALLDALEDGSIGAAGLDVSDSEPPAVDSPLRDHPDIVTTPHVAWYSEEANDQRRYEAAQCVSAVLADETPNNVIVGPDDAA